MRQALPFPDLLDESSRRFALDDASGYDVETGEGVIKYGGRIRFMSSDHGFDIVFEEPWVTFSDGGTNAILSLGMSTAETVGDLSVTRVDAVALAIGEPSSQVIDGKDHLVWDAVPGTFLDSIQPEMLNRFYSGEAADPVTFAIPASVDSGTGETPGEGEVPGEGETPGAGETPGTGTGAGEAPGTGAGSEGSGDDSGLAPTGSGWVPSESDLTEANRGGVSVPATAQAGSEISTVVGTEHAGERVEVYAFSTPTHLGSVVVAANGTVTVKLPADLTGQHRIAAYTADGVLIGWGDIFIETSGAKLARTGAADAAGIGIAAGALLLAGAALLIARRRVNS